MNLETFERYKTEERLGTLIFPNGECITRSPDYVDGLDLFQRTMMRVPFYINLENFYKALRGWKVKGQEVFDQTVGVIAFGSAVRYSNTETVQPIKPKDVDFFILTQDSLVGEKLVKSKTRVLYVESESSIYRGGIHLVMRGVEQFINGVNAGDTVSISMTKEGVPVFDTPQLNEILDQSGITRETPRRLTWSVGLQGKLSGRIQ